MEKAIFKLFVPRNVSSLRGLLSVQLVKSTGKPFAFFTIGGSMGTVKVSVILVVTINNRYLNTPKKLTKLKNLRIRSRAAEAKVKRLQERVDKMIA